MKRFFLYMLAFFVTLTAVSRAEVFVKCNYISGSLNKNLISQLEYIHLTEKGYSGSRIYGRAAYYSWDKKEKKFYKKKVYKTRIQDYKIYLKNSPWANIDRETGILTISDSTFECNKIKESDLPIIEVEQKF
jgi:hypothetical protein